MEGCPPRHNGYKLLLLMEDEGGKKRKHTLGTIMRACDRAASIAAQEKRRLSKLAQSRVAQARQCTPSTSTDALRALRAAERELSRTPFADLKQDLCSAEKMRSCAGALGTVRSQLQEEKQMSSKLQSRVLLCEKKLKRVKDDSTAKMTELKAKAAAREALQEERVERHVRIHEGRYMQIADAELAANMASASLRTELAEAKRALEGQKAELEAKLFKVKEELDAALLDAADARSTTVKLARRVAGFLSGAERRAGLKLKKPAAAAAPAPRRAQAPRPAAEESRGSEDASRRHAYGELQRHAASLSSQQIARALGTETIRSLVHTKEGDPVFIELARGLKDRLEDVWDADLAIELKCTAGVSDSQMDGLRQAFSLVPDSNGKRALPRVWYKSPYSCYKKSKKPVTIHFPSPIRPRTEWFEKWTTLCAKHNISSTGDGQVSQRSFGDVFDLVIKRNIGMASTGAGRTSGFPLDGPIGSADAVSWGHKLKVTHGGLKFADFKQGFSAHSEWNYVTAMIGRMDDGHASQLKLCGEFAEDFGKAMKLGYRDVGGMGRIYFKGGMCTDMAFTRAALGRRAMSSPHCECGRDTDTRAVAIHEPYTLPRGASYVEILTAVQARCKLFTMRRCCELTHTSPPDHDWSLPLRCSACPPEEDGKAHIVFKTKQEEDAEVARLAALESSAAAGDVQAKKALKKECDTFANLHYQFAKYKRPLLWLGIDGSMISWRQDTMHGINLNIAKADFKYSWLDGATGVLSYRAAAPRLRPRRV